MYFIVPPAEPLNDGGGRTEGEMERRRRGGESGEESEMEEEDEAESYSISGREPIKKQGGSRTDGTLNRFFDRSTTKIRRMARRVSEQGS